MTAACGTPFATPTDRGSAFGNVERQSGDPGFFTSCSSAGVNGALEVSGTTDDGGMWHTILFADGSWQLGDVREQSGNPGYFEGMGCAAVG